MLAPLFTGGMDTTPTDKIEPKPYEPTKEERDALRSAPVGQAVEVVTTPDGKKVAILG